MAKKSPTKNAAGCFPAMPPRQDVNVSIRKIENGYVLRESGMRKDGQYYEKERFTPRQPKINIVGTK